MHQHRFTPSVKKGYEVCMDCGTYHSTELLPPDEIYVNKPYWGEDSGRSTLEQQISNMTCTDDCGISKIDRVMQFVPKRGKNVLEIACAPGAMLNALLDRNFEVFGIEPNPQYIDFICKEAKGAKVVCGYFPQVTKTSKPDIFDCIIGLDVWEHSHDYDDFIREVHRLLIPGGTAIIMSPIIYEDGLIKETEFLPQEHAWIFTKKFLQEYLPTIFSEVKFSRWVTGHEVIILKK